MIGEGGLELRLGWDGNRVTGVTVRSARQPGLCRLLEGKPAAEAVGLVPLLFSVCGRAQAVAAAEAAEAASGRAGRAGVRRLRELMVAAECAHEHLWRLILDLPALLGEPVDQQGFIGMRRRFEDVRRRAVAHAPWWEEQGDLRDLTAWRVLAWDLAGFLRKEVLVMEPERFAALAGLAQLQAWLDAGEGLGARLLARVWDLDLGRSSVPLLAWLEARELVDGMAPAMDTSADYAAAPTCRDAPAETGALARLKDEALIATALAGRGNTVGVRLLARLVELARLAGRLQELSHGEAARPWLQAAALGEGGGISAVETARGVLMHRVELKGGRVARYRIVAPTEWNFHPAGAYVQGLAGHGAGSEEEVLRAAALLAHALDPCVAHEVKVDSPTHA